MNIIVMTPVRLLGDGLVACFGKRPDLHVVALVDDLRGLRDALASADGGVALIDVTQGVDFAEVQSIALQWPRVALVALGLQERRQEVINCGRAGFAGYVARDASIDELSEALTNVVAGRLACPPEISDGLLRALFRRSLQSDAASLDPDLTRRECEVLHLIGRGLSNKEIATQLFVSVATIKHHVHHVLRKLQLSGRAQAMRRLRDAPWIAPIPARADLG